MALHPVTFRCPPRSFLPDDISSSAEGGDRRQTPAAAFISPASSS